MSLITNIIHNQFCLVVANKCENQEHGFEKLHLNNGKNIMLMLAGVPMKNEYIEAFKECKTSHEAIALIEHYAAEEYGISANSAKSQEEVACQQCCITYFDAQTQQFCSYTISCTNDQRNMDIKSSVANQIIYRCIGTENSELSALFQLNGVRKKMQQFSQLGKGADDVFEIIEITQKMYDIIHLIDDDVAFNYRAKYWVMDRDTMAFQQVKYNPTYFIPAKDLKPEAQNQPEESDITFESELESQSTIRQVPFTIGQQVA